MALKSLKPHLGIFGRRNVGKSSFINSISGQSVAIVSEQAGTTTDPVKKTVEIEDVGPVVIIDTAGIDDEGEVGLKRIKATEKVLSQIDLAILVINEWSSFEEELVDQFTKKNLPYFIVQSKSDLNGKELVDEVLLYSSVTAIGKDKVIAAIKEKMPKSAYQNPSLLGDLVSYGDVVVLVTPIDSEAPAGRMILPQVQAIRDCLDNDCMVLVTKERELDAALSTLNKKPALVVTDSQAFLKVDASVDSSIAMTSFSMLFARMKGDFEAMVKGTFSISDLEDGQNVLILESCTHHATGDDIGRVKIPRWISNFTGKKLNFDMAAGLNDPPKAMEEYSLVVQCGGCMLTRRQVLERIRPALDKGVPVSNYGMVIAYTQGIFSRAVAPFGFKKTIEL